MQFEITYQDLMSKSPCYDPVRYLSKDWSGDLIDIIENSEIPYCDRAWVLSNFLGDTLNRLFAVYCARSALATVEGPDARSVEACNVAERFALGQATTEELDAARAAAWAAARDAARAVAWDAARAAAWDAARAAAWDAARAAARDAAYQDFLDYAVALILGEKNEPM